MKIINTVCQFPWTCHDQCKALDDTIISIKHDQGQHILHYGDDVDENGNNVFEYGTILQNIKSGKIIPAQSIDVAVVVDPSFYPRLPFVVIPAQAGGIITS